MYSSWSTTPGLRRVLIVPAALLVAVLLFLFPLSRAQAAFQLCRTDPIVTLSNGDVVSIYVEFAADPADVTKIDYKLHVPKGVTAVSIIYMGGELGLVENLTVAQDAKAHEYRSETVVRVSKSVAVKATTYFEQQVKVASGDGGQVLK